MANNYSQATVSPELPASIFSDAELASLSFSCGLQTETHDDMLYFFADESFYEAGEDEDDKRVNCIELFQAKLKQLDSSAYPHIIIEGAATCSKMRSGEFGGFAYFITRDDVRYVATWQWLHEQTL